MNTASVSRSEVSSWVPAVLAAAEGAQVRVEPVALREAVSSAERAGVATPHEKLRRVGAAVGIRVVPVIAPARDLCNDSRGAPLLIWGKDGGWLTITGAERGRAQVRDADDRLLQLSADELATAAGAPSSEHPLLVVTADAALPMHGVDDGAGAAHHGHGHGHGHASADDALLERRALRRVFGLLALEKSDVATCAIYAVFISLAALMAPIAVQSLVNTVVFTTLTQPLVILALALLLALSISSVLRAMQEWVVERLQQRLFVRTSIDFVARLTRARVEALDEVPPGDRALRFFDVVAAQKSISQLLTEGLALALQALAGLLLLAFYHPWLLAFDVILIAVLAVVVFGFGRRAIRCV